MDSSELATLFRRYGFFVQRRCWALLGNAADAEDVTQEVFVRTQRYASSLTAPVTLAWLYSVAANCCFDHLQKRGREEPVDPAVLAETDRRQVGAAGDADRRAMVGRLLRRLDAAARQIAVLHHVEGWTQEEVAERTGLSRKTVGKKLAAIAVLLDAERKAMVAATAEVNS